MESSLDGSVPEYIGADLTDRYSNACRGVNVCGLALGEWNKLAARFWRWSWDPDPAPLEVDAIAKELTGARAAMLDGPQGLAKLGCTLRDCERQSAAVGKTPDARPDLGKPFAGFIRSSLDLFAALSRAGTTISPPGFVGGVSEVYPGHIWSILSGRHVLPKKSTDAGRRTRKRILEALGIFDLPDLPTHDENDACVSAMLAAAADGRITGITAHAIGARLFADACGVFREGPMVIPKVTPEIAEVISQALSDLRLSNANGSLAKTGLRKKEDRSNFHIGNSELKPLSANTLLDRLVANALRGSPEVYTYSAAYRRLFKTSYRKWSRGYAARVIGAARRTQERNLPGLGLVSLDTFVVSKSDGLPSEGHWRDAKYDREDWERILGNAAIIA